MKRYLSILVWAVAFAGSVAVRAETDAEVQARRDALDLAGAFSNEGFKIRDGHWCSVVKPHEHALVALNLYAGNQYWFSAAASEPVKKIAVSVYDETGKQMTAETYDSENRAAAGFSPANSGQYFVSVDLVEGEQGNFCLVYSYK